MSKITQTAIATHVAAVRRFNRFYTRQIGVLHEGLLDSPFSLTEVRVLYEVAHRDKVTAAEISKELGLDPGYLSRILNGFEARRLIRRVPSETDARQNLVELSKHGTTIFAKLDSRSNEHVRGMLSDLPQSEQARLVGAMATIESLLGSCARDGATDGPSYILRPHRPGDMGWVVHRHGVLYAEEHGYDERFEALVASIVAEFIQNFDSKRERCWIAEKAGEIVGCVLLVRKSKSIAKLRLLLVEPAARGLGIGRRLVAECVRFARQTGYKKIMLWTQSTLHAAREIYKRAGFRKVHEEKHHSWGHDLVAETWELKLRSERVDSSLAPLGGLRQQSFESRRPPPRRSARRTRPQSP
jgi:DNA-binding MarR family transcriptional regulator/N-acetylglutamate synthase-like GNAT family acetyltransferase